MKPLIIICLFALLAACEDEPLCWQCTRTTIISYPAYPAARMTVYMQQEICCDKTLTEVRLLNQQTNYEVVGGQLRTTYTRCNLIRE